MTIDLSTEPRLFMAAAQAAMEGGSLTDSEGLLRDALVRFERLGDRMGVAVATLALAALPIRSGRLVEAEPLLRDARSQYEAQGAHIEAAYMTMGLGDLCIRTWALSPGSRSMVTRITRFQKFRS